MKPNLTSRKNIHNACNLPVLLLLCISQILSAQRSGVIPDLSTINDTTKWSNFGREARFDSSVIVEAKEAEGAIWLKNYSFTNGTIEVDLRGKNLQGQSFIGIAFHLVNSNSYDAIYFRPFNFFNTERSTHSVQYISMPDHPWQQLRETFPGKYESKISNPPNPDDWFHALIEINFPTIRVFVNSEKVASLVVEQLSNQKTGSIGLWLGYMSDGQFKNLKITEK